jgi:Acetyltransferases
MTEITIRNYVPDDISKVIDVQKEYNGKYPSYCVRGEEVYTHNPGFENGKNIFCAFNTKGELLAYAPIVSAPVNDDSPLEYPHYIWTDIIYNPQSKKVDLARDLLFERIVNRALEMKENLSERKTRLAVIKFSEEIEGLNYFNSKGFEQYESVFLMNRDLQKPIPDVPAPNSISIKKWKIKTQEDKLKYIKTDNLSNPNNPITMEKLDWYLKTLWSVGSAIGAFDENEELVGSIMTYWFNDNQGITEEIFVLPQWRRKGIAQYLIREALIYLKDCGKITAQLEVKKSNVNAVNLYCKMGYEVENEECSLGLYI